MKVFDTTSTYQLQLLLHIATKDFELISSVRMQSANIEAHPFLKPKDLQKKLFTCWRQSVEKTTTHSSFRRKKDGTKQTESIYNNYEKDIDSNHSKHSYIQNNHYKYISNYYIHSSLLQRREKPNILEMYVIYIKKKTIIRSI